MDLRNVTPEQRRLAIEQELNVELDALTVNEKTLGNANEKNCENMFGQVPIPVGLAGPLTVNGTPFYLPLATTEGALVASINRGCKAITASGGANARSVYHGMSRSICLNMNSGTCNVPRSTLQVIKEKEDEWKAIGESTSNHLKITKYDIDESGDYMFLTIYGDTDQAMGMNMMTIAAQAIGNWLAEQTGAELITIAGNVDSDKKPSQRTHDTGRGYEVTAETVLDADCITSILKSTPEAMLKVADAKLHHGSAIAGAIGSNLHAANVIAALYLATGQDAAHVVEGSLADTTCNVIGSTLHVTVRLPAILVGTIGGGTQLPAQKQCLDLIVQRATCNDQSHTRTLVEVIGAAVLAGELSLLAAQASHTLASAHKKLGR